MDARSDERVCDREDANDETASDGTVDKRPKFGTRYLEETADVFQHNAWDDVSITDEEKEEALRIVAFHHQNPVPEEKRAEYNARPAHYWDQFYSTHQSKFFKNRKWLFTEFPFLTKPCPSHDSPTVPALTALTTPVTATATTTATTTTTTSSRSGVDSDREVAGDRWASSAHATMRVLEVGCGVGNTVFPLLENNTHEGFFVYACDYAPTAVDLVKKHEDYDPQRCHAFVCDISVDELQLPDNSLDVIILVFVLSALHPAEAATALDKLVKCLKPGGSLIMRDYGRHDLAQLRLKKGRLLEDNFYIRGDGTRVYFYEKDEVAALMAARGMVEVENKYDLRLIVNRAKRVTMHRVWLQCHYQKPLPATTATAEERGEDARSSNDV